MTRKVAIMGRAEDSALAPFGNPDWEIWGLPWADALPRVDRFFDIHSQAVWDTTFGMPDGWEREIAARHPGVPVYCDPSRLHAFPEAVAYPLDEILLSLPIASLESTISYEIALAIHEGVSEIGLYGLSLLSDSEYGFQRPSVAYLVGLAQGMGITVNIQASNGLFASAWPSGRYGIDPLVQAKLPHIRSTHHGVAH